MFDRCALLTHLRFQLLQPLRKFFHPDSSDVPKNPRRLPGSEDVTTNSASMRGRVTERDYFYEPLKMVRSQSVANAHVSAINQFSREQHKLKTGLTRKLLTLDEQLNSTGPTQATVFHNLCRDQHEISAKSLNFLRSRTRKEMGDNATTSFRRGFAFATIFCLRYVFINSVHNSNLRKCCVSQMSLQLRVDAKINRKKICGKFLCLQIFIHCKLPCNLCILR